MPQREGEACFYREELSRLQHRLTLNALLLQWLTSGMLLVDCGNTLWVRLNFTGLRVWDIRSMPCRMLEKAAFSPAQPRRAKTRRSTGKAARGMLLLQRFTHLQNAAGGLFQYPARVVWWSLSWWRGSASCETAPCCHGGLERQ